MHCLHLFQSPVICYILPDYIISYSSIHPAMSDCFVDSIVDGDTCTYTPTSTMKNDSSTTSILTSNVSNTLNQFIFLCHFL